MLMCKLNEEKLLNLKPAKREVSQSFTDKKVYPVHD